MIRVRQYLGRICFGMFALCMFFALVWVTH